MATKVTLNLNENLAKKAAELASEQGKSLANFIEDLLENIPRQNSNIEEIHVENDQSREIQTILAGEKSLSPSLKKLSGILSGISDADIEKAKENYLREKYDI